MTKAKISLIFVLLNLTVSLAQNSFVDALIKGSVDQLVFEKVYIHTNKTDYFSDDTIWFKAYVSNGVNKPSYKTTLLYVSLFNRSGTLIKTKKVLINNGVGVNQFELKNLLKEDTYYIQAFTNNMQNFGESNKYLCEINILNEERKIIKEKSSKYDIQLFPEGGYLLENTENTLAIRALINGVNYDYEGGIVDSKNNKISNFRNTYLGMSTCRFFYKDYENYVAEIKINDTVIKVPVPKANTTGVALKLINNKAFIDLELKTNNASLKSLSNDYMLLFHQANKLIDYVNVSFEKSSVIKLNISKDDFFSGVNTVTVFKNSIPILERKFFVDKNQSRINVSAQKTEIKQDSSNYKLSFKNLKGTANISVSILPKTALNYTETQNILSALLLTPYVKGRIVKPSYYFDGNNEKQKNDLDLLLLTQGWVQFTTKEFLDNINPEIGYEFDFGFKLEGETSPALSNRLWLMSQNNVLIDTVFLKGKKFSFKKLLLYKGDSVRLSFIKKNKELIKPKLINFKNEEVENETLISEYIIGKDIYNNTEKQKELNYSLLVGNETVLGEVRLEGKKMNQSRILKKKLIGKYKSLVLDIGKYMNLDIPDKFKNEGISLLDYLQKEENVNLVNWKGLEWYLEYPNKKEALLFVDGERVPSSGLSSLFLNMSDVENVMMKPEGARPRIYHFFTTENYKNNIQELFKQYIIEDGYNKSKNYYTPNNEDFVPLKWQEIDWKPNLITNSLGEINFKIKSVKNSGYLLSIQGFSNNGQLVSELITVE